MAAASVAPVETFWMLPFGTELLAGTVRCLLYVASCWASELNGVSCDLRASCIIQFALAVVISVSAEPVTAPTVVYVHVASANDLHWLTTFAYPCRERAFRLCAPSF